METKTVHSSREKEMKKDRFLILVITLLFFVAESREIEKPQYQVIHAESDFEVRLYYESSWMAAPVTEISFEKATLDGFHRLFQFIQGANLNWTRIPMTAPVVTSIVPGAGPFQSSAYYVLFYLPLKFQADPPVPLPELHLKPYVQGSRCIAVRTFSGFAKDDNIVKEAKKLAASLSRSPWANRTSLESKSAYSIAQYDAPFHFIGRVNEVWADVNANGVNSCEYSNIATY
ncbi:heme-binding protein 2 [Ricinus communis]|uniref:Heme-binding protein, putative n=1 Tax=Ricinus communis TaxID=3988 RepID=B9RAY6_RICCO|nr:heme-binding protein 2 [Ricinus communis]EEF51963.1 Heme-binding protein, putative [Ricinus communis]|eukprot:XP_002511361.1 heme-binding protein 2 [Ricinus communis]